MAQRQSGQFFAAANEKSLVGNHQAARSELMQRGESRLEFTFGACLQDMKLKAELAGSRRKLAHDRSRRRIGRIGKQPHDSCGRDSVVQQLQMLRTETHAEVRD